jgi:hypothetical protein
MYRPTGRLARTKRHPQLTRLSAVAVVVACSVVASFGVPAAGATDAPSPGSGQLVQAFGYSIRVPASWAVHDLSADPTTCVRTDVNAVYLGHPGAEQQCPARVVGSADALLIEPLAGSTAPSAGSVQADAGQPVPLGASEADANQINLVVPDAQVRVTATFDSDASVVRGILQGAVLSSSGSDPTDTPAPAPAVPAGSAAPAATPAAPMAAAPAPTALTANRLSGYGFDACGLPPLATMQAWRTSSPYRTAAVYLGGRTWGCRAWSSPPSASWLSTVSAAGWGVLPIWVGYQAHDDGTRCDNCAQMSLTTSVAWGQGRDEAKAAVTAARASGIAPGVTIAYDMEGWDTSNAPATTAVLALLSGWSATLRANGYKSSVYTSSCSGGQVITNTVGKSGPYGTNGASATFAAPDHMWFASWITTTPTTLNGISCIPDSTWVGKRARQYKGATDETYGGKTMNVDRNLFGALLLAPSNPAAYVKGAIRVLLRRAATSAEITTWSNFLSTNSTSSFINRLVTGSEYTGNTVTSDYLLLLHRDADDAGRAYWAAQLAKSRRNDLIMASIAGSDEYFKDRSSSDIETFVSNLYLDILGRGVDSGGLAYWSGLVRSGALSHSALALSLADSNEYAGSLVAAQYLIILGRQPDAAGKKYWADRYVATHDILQLVVSLAASDEGITYLQGS